MDAYDVALRTYRSFHGLPPTGSAADSWQEIQGAVEEEWEDGGEDRVRHMKEEAGGGAVARRTNSAPRGPTGGGQPREPGGGGPASDVDEGTRPQLSTGRALGDGR